MPECVLCQGRRDVLKREGDGVVLAVCHWCWHRWGPPRHLAADLAVDALLAEGGPRCVR